MRNTVFPNKPGDVAELTPTEFIFDLEWHKAPRFDEVCQRFGADVNRAVVWLIRFRALKAWCAREGMAQWIDAGARTPRDVCEVAACFELNDQWEFDPEAFSLAVDTVVRRRRR